MKTRRGKIGGVLVALALVTSVVSIAGVAVAQDDPNPGTPDSTPAPDPDALISSGPAPVFRSLSPPVRFVDTRFGTLENPAPNGFGDLTTSTRNWDFAGSGVPSAATAVAMNVTALNCTSFVTDLRIWPRGAPVPTVSTMNPVGGETPRTNEVIMGVGAFDDISFVLGNPPGSACDIIVDVVGWFEDHSHRDEYGLRIYSASVTSAGALTTGNAVSAQSTGATGFYEVIFPTNISNCQYIGSLGRNNLFGTANGGITVVERGGNANGVFVSTTNSAGSQIDNNFTVLIHCT